MAERKKVLVVAPNPYIVTNIINELDWRVPVDFEKAYTIEEAKKLFDEKKPAVVILDMAVIGEKTINLAEIFDKCAKPKCGLILLTSLKSFAELKIDMNDVLEVFEKPYDNISIANSLKKALGLK